MRSVVVHESPTGPTGLFETVHIYSGPTGPTGLYPTWQAVEGGPTGFFKHVINGGATAGRRNVIINGYAPPVAPFDYAAVLGTDLIACWDANRGDLVQGADNINGVQTWLDIVAGYPLTAADIPSRPIYKPNGLAGGPAVSFDTTQYLSSNDAGLMAALPSGATPSEMWALVSQDALIADNTTRYIGGWAGASVTSGRAMARLVSTLNRAKSYTGTGAAAPGVINTTLDFSGVHVLRQQTGATSTLFNVDSGSNFTDSSVPNTTNTIMRMGSIPALGATNNWNGMISVLLITKPLSAPKAAALHAYLG